MATRGRARGARAGGAPARRALSRAGADAGSAGAVSVAGAGHGENTGRYARERARGSDDTRGEHVNVMLEIGKKRSKILFSGERAPQIPKTIFSSRRPNPEMPNNSFLKTSKHLNI